MLLGKRKTITTKDNQGIEICFDIKPSQYTKQSFIWLIFLKPDLEKFNFPLSLMLKNLNMEKFLPFCANYFYLGLIRHARCGPAEVHFSHISISNQ